MPLEGIVDVFELLQRFEVTLMNLITLIRPKQKKLTGRVVVMQPSAEGVVITIADRYHTRHEVKLPDSTPTVSAKGDPMRLRWSDGTVLAQGEAIRVVGSFPQLEWNVILSVPQLDEGQTFLYFEGDDYERDMILATLLAVAARKGQWTCVEYSSFVQMLTNNPFVVTDKRKSLVPALFEMAAAGELEIVRVGEGGPLWIVPSVNLALEALGVSEQFRVVPLTLESD